MERLFFVIIIVSFSLFLGCNNRVLEEEDLLDFEIIDSIFIENQELYGTILYANMDQIYILKVKKPSIVLDLISGEIKEIGAIGEGPGEYELFPQNLLVDNETLFLGNTLKGELILYDSSYNYITEKKNFFLDGGRIFKLNDSLFVGTRKSKDFAFVVYNQNTEQEIIKIGKPIEYSGNLDKSSLFNEGLQYPIGMSWCLAADKIYWYDRYNDKIRVYDVFSNSLDTIFGQKHEGFGIPPVVEHPGDAYHEATKVATGAEISGLTISENYLFILLGKNWETKNWIFEGLNENERRNIQENNFYFIDVYNINNYEYCGTFYPINDYIYHNDIRYIPYFMNAENDTTLNIYFNGFNDCEKYIKIKVLIHNLAN